MAFSLLATCFPAFVSSTSRRFLLACRDLSFIFVHVGCTFSVMVLFCFTSAILYNLPHLTQCSKYFIELYSLFLLDLLLKAMGGLGRKIKQVQGNFSGYIDNIIIGRESLYFLCNQVTLQLDTFLLVYKQYSYKLEQLEPGTQCHENAISPLLMFAFL